MSVVIELDLEEKSFSGDRDAVLKQLHLHLEPGEFVAVVGPSGVGKSTLLKILSGIDDDFDGRLKINRSNGDQGPPRLGYVFQSPRLMPWLSARTNVEIVLNKDTRETATQWLQAVELDDCQDKYPHELSGGMQRRVALARSLAVAPDLLLLDEPFNSLNAALVERLHRLLLDDWRRRQTTIILVTHDLAEALSLADRIIVIGQHHAVTEHRNELPRPRVQDSPAFQRALDQLSL